MTQLQVQTLTDQELDEWLAVNCMGWREEEHPEVHGTGQWMAEYEFPVYFKPDGSFILSGDFAPCTDPAASLEVEKVAIEHNFDAYVQNLAIVKWGEPDDDVEDTAVWNKTMRYSIAELLTASPRERAEAAYMTLQAYQVDKQ
ncbi:MAG TPA: hypothetical protein VGI33_07345 [Paenibacillus sp.]|jgi:hypothetical protein